MQSPGGAKVEATALVLNESAVGVRIADFKTLTYQKKRTILSPSVLFFKSTQMDASPTEHTPLGEKA